MTGRDLIMYILQNKLEDQEVFKNGFFVGFMDIKEAAVKFGVGESTVRVWCSAKMLPSFKIGGELYIPKDSTDPRKVAKL